MSISKEGKRYYIVAYALVLVLTLVGLFSRNLFPELFPLVFLAYAIPATLGALYHVVIWRTHKQLKLSEDGKLSGMNRKWTFWLIGLFVGALASSFLFVLQAPSWKFEWLFIWLAVPIFYLCYLCLKKLFRHEYAEAYYKASAIKWSSFIATICLCLLYGFYIAHTNNAPENVTALLKAIDERPIFFKQTGGILFQVENVTSLYNCLIKYGINSAIGGNLVAIVIYKIITGGLIFYTIVSIYGFCLLSPAEIKDEFKLLSSKPGSENQNPIRISYLVLMLAVWAALSGGFLALNSAANDGVISTVEYVDQLKEKFKSAIKIDFDKDSLKKSVEQYYEEANSKIDDYINWKYDSLDYEKALVVLDKDKQIELARKRFTELVINSLGDSEIQRDIGKIDSACRTFVKNYSNYKDSVDDALSKINESSLLWISFNNQNGETYDEFIAALLPQLSGNRAQDKAAIERFIDSEERKSLDELTTLLAPLVDLIK